MEHKPEVALGGPGYIEYRVNALAVTFASLTIGGNTYSAGSTPDDPNLRFTLHSINNGAYCINARLPGVNNLPVSICKKVALGGQMQF